MLRKALTTFALGCLLAASGAHAQSQPTRLIVPFNPGGGSDLFARLVAPGLGTALGETVIVENRAGAGGLIGTEAVIRSKPDSKMLLVSDSAIYTIAPYIYTSLGFKPNDMIPVANLASFGNVLVVNANSPYKTLQDVLDAARKKPASLNIGSAGNGSITHLAAAKLMEQAKIELVHVPYKGSGPAISDVAGGHLDMVFTGLPSVLELLRAGKLRALGLATLERSPYAPDVPTIHESGVPGFEAMISQGLFAAPGTPPETVKQLNAAVVAYVKQPGTQETLRKMMVEPVVQSESEYRAWLDSEARDWSALIKRADIKVE